MIINNKTGLDNFIKSQFPPRDIYDTNFWLYPHTFELYMIKIREDILGVCVVFDKIADFMFLLLYTKT